MKNKRLSKAIISILLLVSFLFVIFPANITQVFAQEIDYSAEECAKHFLLNVYDSKNITYSEMNTLYSLELYDDEDSVIAQVSVFERDGKIDYAIYNYILEGIDEYGFDCPEIIDEFPEGEKIYYAGVFNYYTAGKNEITNTHSNQIIDKNILFDKIKEFKNKLIDRRNAIWGSSTKPGAGSEGIINWADVVQDEGSGWENSASNYLDGIDRGTGNNNYGVPGDGLGFEYMDTYETDSIKSHCGPIALLNIMIYYDWLGMNTIPNNSTIKKNRLDTFNRLRILCNHDSVDGTSWTNAISALSTYMSEMGHSISTNYFQNDFDEYKAAINSDKVVLTLVNVMQSDGENWGHFVVTLGYEEFRQEYEKQILWWTVTEYNYLRYIRVCDGWTTANKARYISLDGFYDSYQNSAITIN